MTVNLSAVPKQPRTPPPSTSTQRFAAPSQPKDPEPSKRKETNSCKTLQNTPTTTRVQRHTHGRPLRNVGTQNGQEDKDKQEERKVTVLCSKPPKLSAQSKNEWQAVQEEQDLMKMMKQIQPQLQPQTSDVQNIVASVQIIAVQDDTPGLPLKEIADKFGLRASYEKTLFPGAIIRFPWENCTLCFLVFRKGACVITGAKNERILCRVYRAFYWAIIVHLLDICAQPENAQYRHLANNIPKYMRNYRQTATKTTVTHSNCPSATFA